jgi:hypothetical protein
MSNLQAIKIILSTLIGILNIYISLSSISKKSFLEGYPVSMPGGRETNHDFKETY